MLLRAASGAPKDVSKMPQRRANEGDLLIDLDEIEPLNLVAPSREISKSDSMY